MIKKSAKIVSPLIGLTGLCISLLSMVHIQQPESWEVPEKFRTMENPVAKTDSSIQKGMLLYKKHCGFCHGTAGLGDGVKARQMQTFAGDFSGEYYQNQTDGEHFYKTKTGRREMPAYENKITDEDIWHIVNYMRTFKK